MTQKIKRFYSYFRSSTAYRLRIALSLKGVVPEETIFINLKEGEQHRKDYQLINPAGAVPAIELENGEILTQSMALLEWLEENYPTPSILPEDLLLRAKVRAFANLVTSDIHPINNLRILKYLEKELNVIPEDKIKWLHHWMHKGFEALEAMLTDQNSDFCYSNTPTMADICLIPQIYNALRFEVDMAPYPKLMAIYNHALQHDAFIASQPEKQPDCNLPS